MKTIRLMMMAGLMAFASAANAQQVTVLTAKDVNFEEGATQADLVVNMDYTTTEKVVAWGFSLYLPDGISLIYDEEEEEWLGEVGSINAKKVVNKGLSVNEKTDGGYLIVGYADGNPAMKSTHGDLATITLQGNASIKSNGKISGISISNDLSESLEQGNIAEVEFKINGGAITDGINDIQAVDSNAPAYNLQGMRVNGQAKGLIIRDGKKMVVK